MVGIHIYLYDQKMESLFDGISNTNSTYPLTITTYHRHKDKRNKAKKCKNFNSIEDRFIWESLKDAPENEYVLVCCDRLISNCSPSTIYNCIEYFIDHCTFDIFYLASWADRCDLYSDIHEIENYKIVKSQSPHGTACLLFSPEGRKKFLNSICPLETKSLDFTLNAQMDCFEVYTTTPSLIEFDITQRETDLEYVKLCKCREVPSMVRPVEITRRNTTTLNLFWFILVIIIIVCIATILLSIDVPVMTAMQQNISNNSDVFSVFDNNPPQPPFDPVGTLGSYRN